jgi:hypothetical protein
VPGTIYQISTSVPKPAAASAGATPVAAMAAAFDESMTYSGEHDATP